MSIGTSDKKVWVNGTFDVLHLGHISLLEYASTFGKLRVGIDTDKRVKELKGSDRPFNNQDDRKKMLEAIKFVSEVVLFDSREELINSVKEYEPDFMIVGDDYQGEIVYGSEHAEELIYFKKIPNYSSSKILNYYKND